MKEINLTKQKVLIWGLGGVLVLVVLMLGVMFLGGGGKKNSVNEKKNVSGVEEVDKQDANKVNQNNDKKNQKIAKLAEGNIYGLTISPGTNLAMFYQDQKFLTVDPFTGKVNALSSYPLSEIKKLIWNEKRDKAIVNDAGDYYIYKLNENLVSRFRDKIDVAIWGRADDKVIYKYYNSKTKKRKIRIADIDGQNSQLVVDNLPYRKVDLALEPLTNKVCYWPVPDARIKGVMFCVDLDGKDAKEYGGQYGEDYLWSPDGQKILVSFSREEAGNKLVLGVMNKNGGEMKGLAFATSVKKCVWAKDGINVYCAMIGGAPLDVMLPNAWQEEAFNSADTFWKINTNTGKKERLVDLENIPNVLDADSLTLDKEEKFLFFRARRDGSLWRIKL